MLLNLIAGGLAEPRPKPAAVIQGTIGVVLHRATPNAAPPHTEDSAHTNTVVTFIAGVRHDATQLIVAALGEPRIRELHAQGVAMTEDQACTYARTHIDEYLATNHEQLP